MKIKNLSDLIGNDESTIIEWKPSLSQINDIIETATAFANTEGGNIFIGVSKNGKLLGIQIGKDTIEKLTNELSQHTDPKIHPKITTKKIEDKEIIIIEVKESTDHLVLAFGRPYKRVGKSTVKMSKDEYENRILEKHKEKLQFDSQIYKEAKIKDIDKIAVKEFLKIAKTERGLDISSNLQIEEILMRLKLLQDNKLTNSAVLLFGKNPQNFFLQSEIKCVRFKGTDVTGTMIDMKDIGSNLINQIIEAEKFVFNHISLSSWIEENKIEREEKWEYPPKAIREALVNAVAHRDYYSSSKVQIRIFDDRIEIWNPGKLPKGWTIETLKQKHKSQPFNPIIARVFFWIKYIEEVGTGTNKIIEWCKEWGLPEPDFEYVETSLIVTLKKTNITEEYLKSLDLNERQRKTIEYLKKYRIISNKEYREINQIGKVIAVKELNQLVSKGVLRIRGKGRALKYELND